MTANFGLPSVGAENRDAYMKALLSPRFRAMKPRRLALSGLQAPMSVKFEIPYFTVSGVTVRWTHLLLFDRSPRLPLCQVSQNYREVWLSGYIHTRIR